jgi:hypothetical protein
VADPSGVVDPAHLVRPRQYLETSVLPGARVESDETGTHAGKETAVVLVPHVPAANLTVTSLFLPGAT